MPVTHALFCVFATLNFTQKSTAQFVQVLQALGGPSMQFMSHFKSVLYLSIILVSMFGCGERSAEIKNSNSYFKSGVSFEYPGNWKITEDVEDDDYRYIFVESPGDAISTIQIYSKRDSFSLLEFVKMDIENFKSNMPKIFSLSDKGKILEITRSVEGKTFNGYKYKFTLSVFGVDVPHISEFYMLQSDTENSYIKNQVAVEDLDKVEVGFMQIIRNFEANDALTKLSN